jgi:phosphoribosylformylglycinamidine cyclo-ligase
MPDFYSADEYDLAGFIVGIVERDKVLDGSRVRAGDVLIGLPSSGLHTNGYTLARKIVFEAMGLTVNDTFPGADLTVGDVLLDVHRSYLNVLKPVLETNRITGLAHITGGGIPGNLPRILGTELGARVDLSSWDVPNTFQVLGEGGGVERDEMLRVFNMGVGMIVLTAPDDADQVLSDLRDGGAMPWVMGEVEAGEGVRW